MVDNMVCSLCGTEEENLNHLFFECEYSFKVWTSILDILKVGNRQVKFREVTTLVDSYSRKKTRKAQLILMYFAEAVHGIWLERNCQVFNNTCKPPEILLRQIIFNVASRSDDKCRNLLMY